MRKLAAVVFALAMIVSIVFIGEAASSSAPFSVNAQAKVHHRRHGIARRYYMHSKAGVKKGWYKTKKGTKWTAHKTKHGTKHTYRKAKDAVQ